MIPALIYQQWMQLNDAIDVNQGNYGWTPLIVSAKQDSPFLPLLIQAGADVNQQNENGDTALMFAAEKRRTENLKHLIQAGADVNRCNKNGETATMRAAVHGLDKTLRQLIEPGADVNAKDTWHWTAMHYAAMSGCTGDVNCIAIFLRAKAKINMMNSENNNSLQQYICMSSLWKEGPNKSMVILLYAAGETVDGTTVASKDEDGGNEQVSVLDYLFHEDLKLNLKHLCRETIRKHLICINEHQHLFDRIPQLGLPSSMTEYLLYNVSLNDYDR